MACFSTQNILLMSLPWVIVPIVYYGMVAGFEKDRFISAIVLLWYILYPSLVSRSVEMLKCTDSIDGITYLEVDPNIPCFHGEHFVSVIFAVIAIIVYVIGLPVLALRTLHFSRTFINCRKTKVWYFIRWLFSYVLVVGNSCSVEKNCDYTD